MFTSTDTKTESVVEEVKVPTPAPVASTSIKTAPVVTKNVEVCSNCEASGKTCSVCGFDRR
jgi:hypothetical protein